MGIFITSEGQASAHGVYVIERSPSPTITAQGTGVVGYVAQFPWGPKDEIYEPASPLDAKLVFAPPGMSRIGSGYLGLIAKAFPSLRIVRVLGSASAAATATLTDAPTNVATVTAKYHGAAGNSLVATVSAATDGDANHFDLAASVTGASGTWTDTIRNINFSGLGTEFDFNALPAADINALRLIGDVAKLNSGRPDNGTYTFSSGADGTIDAARYVGTAGSGDRGIAILEGDKAIRHVCVDDPGDTIRAAVNAGLAAHALLMGDRCAYINGDSGQSAADARTDVAGYRSQFVFYIDPWCYIRDDTTQALQLVPPGPFAASVAAQLSPSTAIAWKSTEVQAMLSGIVKLEAARGLQAPTNTNQGIITLIKEELGGHTFEADVVTNAPVDPVRRRGQRQRMLIAIAVAITSSWRTQVDAPNVEQLRDELLTAVQNFLDTLKGNQNGDPNHTPHIVDFATLPLEETNTADDIAAGKVTIGADIQTSAGAEFIFFSAKAGETPVAKIGQ